MISIIGGIFVAYLAYGNFRAPRLKEEVRPGRSPVTGQRGSRQCPEPSSLSFLVDGGRAGYRPGVDGKPGRLRGFPTDLFYLPGRRQDVDGLDYRQVQTMAQRKGLPGHPVYPGGPFGCLCFFSYQGRMETVSSLNPQARGGHQRSLNIAPTRFFVRRRLGELPSLPPREAWELRASNVLMRMRLQSWHGCGKRLTTPLHRTLERCSPIKSGIACAHEALFSYEGKENKKWPYSNTNWMTTWPW